MTRLPQHPDFPKLEEEVMEFWGKNNILERYLNKNATAKKHFSFLDGPITANNPMGVHHGWGRTYKDLWQRYYTMRGFKQRYQNGFDAQGLWVEVEVEKELGFKNKKDIEAYGIDQFVRKCQERVLKFAAIQTQQSQRLGYFMDWEHSYITMSDENNYSIWHFLKKCADRNLIYKGYDSVPWCPRCGTAISQHEILTEEYKELTHTSVYVKYPIVGQANTFLLIWTTTPWTLIGNVAVAVGKDIEYVKAELKGEVWLLAKERLKTIPNFQPERVTKVGNGQQLTKLEYRGPFDELESVKKALNGSGHPVVLADFVNLEEGTGLVHIAPGAGAEDYALAQDQKLPVIPIVEEDGSYTQGLGSYTNRQAVRHPSIILDDLAKKGFVLATVPHRHRYPTCWRCKSELIFRLVDEWYIKMEPIRADIMTLAKKIRWLPSWGLDRELDWLKGMADWLISKKRYWGLALPIFECANCHHFTVVGSRQELKERVVEGWAEFVGHSPHRPWVDRLKIGCQCGAMMSRIPDVGNPWLDAGIVPFSTLTELGRPGVSYFDDPGKTYWRRWFPADFITESFPGQFRNWFYSLLAMAVVLENRPPFRTVLGYGLVRDERGEEMHKSKGNAIEFNEAAARLGADPMRWLYVRSNPEFNLNFGDLVVAQIRQHFLLLVWHTVNFYLTYRPKTQSTLSRATDPRSLPLVDRWILSRLAELTSVVTQALDNFDAMTAAWALERFVVEDFSRWYIRLNRKRTDPNFYPVLYQVITEVIRLLAPFIPYLTEFLFQRLKLASQPASIHLVAWPSVKRGWLDQKLNHQMTTVRSIVSQVLAKRDQSGIKIRQPLPSVKIINSADLPQEMLAIIQSAVNVKKVSLKVNRSVSDPRVSLDTRINRSLQAEGQLRETVRLIQQLRKLAGYRVGQPVTVYWSAKSASSRSIIQDHRPYFLTTCQTDLVESATAANQPIAQSIGDLTLAIKPHRP